LNDFEKVSAYDVSRLITHMADKSSSLDVIPTSLLKNINIAVSPFIAMLANISFQTGTFPTSFKLAEVAPILKKVELSTDELPTTELQADFEPTDYLKDLGMAGVVSSDASCICIPENR